MMTVTARWLRRLRRSEKGTAAVEFALVAPVLAGLMLSGYEASRYIFLTQKLDRVSSTIADIAARGETLSNTEVDSIFDAANHLASPYDFANSGRVILTAVRLDDEDDPPVVTYQRTSAGSLSVSSRIGTQGGDAVLPNGLVLDEGASAIFAEVFFAYEPFFGGDFVNAYTIYKVSMYRPRSSNQMVQTGG
ncbi:TadE/TadG family type IV pilus assembly protein [Oceanibacterium hippocampi]|uniref:TadE-like protein n=1 Tax=Oceanibacterium hippocampi TaxID=745714 RepID=A0A1Y5SCE5_9PROT|nr:TadE/TadG family type IV pilus assembly protein [Oceanibacterium hippocampi]SLN36428.1 TadE-like protein [Oceanibacterium hippocampi]